MVLVACEAATYHVLDNRYLLADVAGALEAWTTARQRDPMATFVWICSLCLNQHRMVRCLSPAELAAEFGPRVTQIGRLLPMLAP